MKTESTKQSEDPESTKALTDTGNRREKNMTVRATRGKTLGDSSVNYDL